MRRQDGDEEKNDKFAKSTHDGAQIDSSLNCGNNMTEEQLMAGRPNYWDRVTLLYETAIVAQDISAFVLPFVLLFCSSLAAFFGGFIG